jgi:hypothetical protein
MLEADIPEVLAELTATFEAYEKALVTNDIETLNNLFWDSPATVRFGTRDIERQYGHAEIAEFRIRRGAVNAERALQNRRITTFGRNFGLANTEFRTPASNRIGRQSQTWMRTANGWKIVGAHVSYGT